MLILVRLLLQVEALGSGISFGARKWKGRRLVVWYNTIAPGFRWGSISSPGVADYASWGRRLTATQAPDG